MTSVNLDSLTPAQQDIPDFILKLYNILQNDEFMNIICWSSNGGQIQIKNQKKMQDAILPIYFRHQKIESFIRQLNMYRFKKIHKIGERNIFFKNDLFKKGSLKLLHLIVRKKKGQQDRDESSNKELHGLEEYKLFVKQNILKIQEDINALRRRHPEIIPELVEILNSTSMLMGEVYKESSETDESHELSMRNLSAPSMLFVSNNDFDGLERIAHFDSKCSIDFDLENIAN